jgi:hypothetical protein
MPEATGSQKGRIVMRLKMGMGAGTTTRRTHKSARLLLFALFSLPLAHAQKVKVEYDKKADFSQYKTYSWVKMGVGFHPTLQAETMEAIDQQLQAKGVKHVESGGDLLVNVMGSLSEGMNVSYDAEVYLMPGLDAPITWDANGAPIGASTAVYVDKGTLVVDLVDRRAKQLKWRGTAKAALDPEHQEKWLAVIEKSLAKMFHEYPAHP